MKERFVVIGGDAAGMSAASKARRENPDLEIIALEKGNWASYGACGLPYYIKGDIENIESLVAISPEKFREKRNIDLRLNHEVIKINPDSKELIVKNQNENIVISYDNLLISTGARAVKPKIEGIDLPDIFILRSMDSGKAIKEHLEKKAPKSVLIIGGGYIGMEMAEAFHIYNMEIHVVEMLPQVLSDFGIEIAKVVEDRLSEYITLHLNKYVSKIEKHVSGKLTVQLTGKEKNDKDQVISVDMMLVAVGVAPEVSLAEKAGIKLGPTGAIATDEYGQTNIPNIFAAGDCAETRHIITGKPVYVPLALTANRNGRAIGSTIGGKATGLAPIAGTAVVKVFQLEVATTGIIDLEVAHQNGFDPVEVTVDTYSRAGYCPKSKPIKIVLLADKKSKRLLGSSMVGEEGIVKRIDIIATAISGKFTVEQLERLDLAYAPPFSPVWDPVLTAARVLNGKLQ